MNKSEHMPGPWKVDIGHQTKRPRGISSPYGNVVNWGGISKPNSDMGRANARLIAACPDLLKALGDLEFAPLDVDFRKAARVAIALVEGESIG